MELKDRLAAMREGGPLPPYDEHMGFRVANWGDVVELEVDVDPSHANPNGVLHGGVLCGLMDSAMGLSMSDRVPEGMTCTNMDLSVRFLRATDLSRPTTLRAIPRVVKSGRRVWQWECDVYGQGAHIARASSAFLVLEPTSA